MIFFLNLMCIRDVFEYDLHMIAIEIIEKIDLLEEKNATLFAYLTPGPCKSAICMSTWCYDAIHLVLESWQQSGGNIGWML